MLVFIVTITLYLTPYASIKDLQKEQLLSTKSIMIAIDSLF